jgi:histidine triad (HIT) family protein
VKADCVFCKIVEGAIPSPRVREDAEFICIRDIHPQAKTHLLVIPKTHVDTLEGADAALSGKLLSFATEVARETGLLPAGFRTIINTGVGGGQTVFHLHAHLLGGEQLGERL